MEHLGMTFRWGSKNDQIDGLFRKKNIILDRDLFHQQFQGTIFLWSLTSRVYMISYTIPGWCTPFRWLYSLQVDQFWSTKITSNKHIYQLMIWDCLQKPFKWSLLHTFDHRREVVIVQHDVRGILRWRMSRWRLGPLGSMVIGSTGYFTHTYK